MVRSLLEQLLLFDVAATGILDGNAAELEDFNVNALGVLVETNLQTGSLDEITNGVLMTIPNGEAVAMERGTVFCQEVLHEFVVLLLVLILNLLPDNRGRDLLGHLGKIG
jgi:hypothetical protein